MVDKILNKKKKKRLLFVQNFLKKSAGSDFWFVDHGVF